MNESVSIQTNGLRTYRPDLTKYIFDDENFKKRVFTWLDGVKAKSVSRALLLSGAPGLGKTTLAQALCKALGTEDADIQQVNCGTNGGKDDARDLISRLNFSPAFGEYRALILDECHKLTRDAQSAFLTPLENLPEHVIVIACTSEPEQMNSALRSRFFQLHIEKYTEEGIISALEGLPGVDLGGKDLLAIARAANGNMRKAIDLVEGGSGATDETLTIKMNAIEMFYPLLMDPKKHGKLLYALAQLTENDKRLFFDRVLALLEGTWMTLVGEKTFLMMKDEKAVVEQISKWPLDQRDAWKKFVARCYRELAVLQDKPIQSIRGWVMTLV